MANIDIASPGADENALRSALLALIAPVAPTIDISGAVFLPLTWQLSGAATVVASENTFKADGPNLMSLQIIGSFNDINEPSQPTAIGSSDLVGIIGGLEISKCPDLVSVSWPALTMVVGSSDYVGYTHENLPSLTTLGLDALQYCSGFALNFLTALTNINLPALVVCDGQFDVNNNDVLTSVSAPLCVTVRGNALDFQFDPLLTTVEFPSLLFVQSIHFVSCDAMVTVEFPVVTRIFNLVLSDCPNMTSFSLPLMEAVGGAITVNGNMTGLTTFTLGSSLKFVADSMDFSGAALDQTSVDGLLVQLAALDGTNGTTSYDGHTINFSGSCAAPSATGLTAKSTLEGRGNTVTVNS